VRTDADVDLLLLQFDIHSPANTVYEALNFSSELRLEGVDKNQRKAFVNEVCKQSFVIILRCPCRESNQSAESNCRVKRPHLHRMNEDQLQD